MSNHNDHSYGHGNENGEESDDLFDGDSENEVNFSDGDEEEEETYRRAVKPTGQLVNVSSIKTDILTKIVRFRTVKFKFYIQALLQNVAAPSCGEI